MLILKKIYFVMAIFIVLFLSLTAHTEAAKVVCEPQPGSGFKDEDIPIPGPYGNHTGAPASDGYYDYWYEVTPEAGESLIGFDLYTGYANDVAFDYNFKNQYQPEGWSFVPSGGHIRWSMSEGEPLIPGQTYVFGFDYPTQGDWAHWNTLGEQSWDMSAYHSGEDNGYGYLVHTPTMAVIPEPSVIFLFVSGLLGILCFDKSWLWRKRSR